MFSLTLHIEKFCWVSSYDKATIETIVNAISSSTNNRINRELELHLTSNYIHTTISSIFGSYDIIPIAQIHYPMK